MKNILSFLLVLVYCAAAAQTGTQRMYLSGVDKDHTVDWSFYCTEGRHSGVWTTIPVPSNWELQGFGKYNYGLDKDSVKGHEQGLYKYKFLVPAAWKGKEINIVFDGSMTDTEVKINGKKAGAVHQGSFYRFTYAISGLLKYGKENLLEVRVSKESANHSVNMAERHGDFWIFGGIYRPVYLEAMPKEHIAAHSLDAAGDGHFTAALRLSGVHTEGQLTATVYSLSGERVGDGLSAAVHAGDTLVRLSGNFPGIASWNPETPNLYKVIYTLSTDGKPVHVVEQRFGFRTVELRERDGIYVNGIRIKFKGVNRHAFWPSSGRTTSKELSIEDVQLIKDMNMNAVRLSHYPPDEHFLDVCDSLGLFVLDELTGWHHAYDTEVGSKLVKEMIVRDVNHPSIVIWDNGNEGGFNFDLDHLFDELDIQHRPLIHPWAVFRYTDTQHYINYDYGNGTHAHGHDIYFPTEFLHGLYDGGHGAGLSDYWESMWHDPLSAGGFLWVFSDEAVVRTDKNGVLDSDGDHGPDGILGPYREKEGSFFAIKEIWSPVKIERREITPAFDGKFTIANRYFYTNLNKCRFEWKMKGHGHVDSGAVAGPDVMPGASGTLNLSLPANWANYTVLSLVAKDPTGRVIYKWSWPIERPATVASRLVDTAGSTVPVLKEEDTTFVVSAGSVTAVFGKKSGRLVQVKNEKGIIPFNNGPVLVAGVVDFATVKASQRGSSIFIEARGAKESLCSSLKWTIYPSGWIKMDIRYFPPDYEYSLLGVSFDYPEKGKDSVSGIEWMGDGPYRVWKNRMQGVTVGTWNKTYNNTVTGEGDGTHRDEAKLIYPEFKGYFSHFYWMKLKTAAQPFEVVCASEDVFLRLFTPASPVKAYNVVPAFPDGAISFMQAIPPIGTKSQKAEKMGPSGAKSMYYDYSHSADYAKEIQLYFNFTGK